MQYISPLHLLELSDVDTIDRKDLLLAKKKMLAELELNDGKGVEINGKELSRNDIIRFFDDLQQSSDLSWHLALYHDKVLLRLLEHNLLEKKDRFADNPLYADEAFITWLGPYYAHSFTAFADECFANLRQDEWATLMSNPLLMNSYQQETVWEQLEKNMAADIEKLKFYADRQPIKSAISAIAPICDFRHVQMLERLPEERFARLRDELAFAIMQVSITIFNHADQGWARTSIVNAQILAVSDELKTQISDKKYEMETAAAGRSSSGKVHWWTIVRIALFVLFVASRVSDGCNRSNNNYNNYNNYKIDIPSTYHTYDSNHTLQERMKSIQDNPPAFDSSGVPTERLPEKK